MFADDTTLTTTGTSIINIANDLNNDLPVVSIVKWCEDNHININIDKTKAMLISSQPKRALISSNKPDLKINDYLIQYSNEERLLGVTVDNTLSWSAQISNTIKKCNSLLYLLGRVKLYLDISSRKLFFNAYILPHLDYCCTIWGNCNDELLNQVIKFQKRAARLILDSDIYTPSVSLFTELGWMRFDDRLEYRKLF